MAEKPENTFALGAYLQLLYRHLPGIAKTKSIPYRVINCSNFQD